MMDHNTFRALLGVVAMLSVADAQSARLDALVASCAAANADEATCSAVTRDTSLEAPELVHIPTCEFTPGRGGGRRNPPVGTCSISGALEQIERCEVLITPDSCNILHDSAGCLWEADAAAPNGGYCAVQALYIAAYLPWMCSTYADDEPACLASNSGLCHSDSGDCVINQAAIDLLHEQQCTDWEPGSDCTVLGNTCNARGAPDSNLGCCLSAIENSGEELCITDWNAFDGHDDCLNGQDESPCMWGYRVQQCADTGIFDDCFPNANQNANFGGGANAGANVPGGGGPVGGNLRPTSWCNGTDDGTGTNSSFVLIVDVPIDGIPDGSVARQLFDATMRTDVGAALGGLPADNVAIDSVEGDATVSTIGLTATDAAGAPLDYAVVLAAFGTAGQAVAGLTTQAAVTPKPGAACALNRRRNGCQQDGGNCVYTPPPAPPTPTCEGTDDGTGTNTSFVLTFGVDATTLAAGSVARTLFEANLRTDVGVVLGGMPADDVHINTLAGDATSSTVGLTVNDAAGNPIDYAQILAAFGTAGVPVAGVITLAPVTPQPGAPCETNGRASRCQVAGGNCVYTPAPGGGGGFGGGRRLAALPDDAPEFMRQLQQVNDPGLFPADCSRNCQRSIAAAKAIGCMDMPELLGPDLAQVTPEQWDSYGQVCDCQNAQGRRGAPAGTPEHLACCDSMIATLGVVQNFEHDDTLTCNATEAAAMTGTLSLCEAEGPFVEMVCEFGMLCPASVDETVLNVANHTCMDWVTVDISLIGDVHTVLGSDPSGPMLTAWAQYVMPTMMPGLRYNTDTMVARFEGNGVQIIVSVACPDAVCPPELLAADPVCVPGDVLIGEPEFVCTGGATLPAGGVLPANIIEMLITNSYIETESHGAGWSYETAAFCKDLEADFMETGQLMCLLDEEGASDTQNAQLMGLATAFGGRGGFGRRQLQFGGFTPPTPTCYDTCQVAIQPLLDSCLDYSEIAQSFETLCAPANVVPGGFDATCLAGVDHLLITCGLESPENLNNQCSQECGGWAGPWWSACRDHIGPLLDAEVPGSSLMLEGFIARCPTPCATVSTEVVLETVISSVITEANFLTAMAGAAAIPVADIQVLDMTHVAIVGVSIPGATGDYAADSTSGAADLIKGAIALSTGMDVAGISILDVMATATMVTPAPPPPPGGGGGFGGGGRPTTTETHVVVELAMQGSGHTTTLTQAVAALPAAMADVATAAGVDMASVVIARSAKAHTEVSYRLPDGVEPPDNVNLMTHLMSDTGTLAVVNTVTHSIPVVALLNDGSVCARNGEVCSDVPGSALPPPPPAPPPAPTPIDCAADCPVVPAVMDNCQGADLVGSGQVGVDSLLFVLSMFGRVCAADPAVGGR